MDGSKLNQVAAESYSKSFSSKILDNFFATNEGITGQQIVSVTPIKQVNFFVLKVLFNQWQEETKKFQSPFFNYKNTEVKTALRSLVNTLSKNIYIERDDFQPLLERAVIESLMLLYSPKEFYLSEWGKLPKSNSAKSFKGISKYVKTHRKLFDLLVQEVDALQSEMVIDLEFKRILTNVMGSYSIDSETINKEAELFNAILPIDIVDEKQIDTPSSIKETTPVIEENVVISSDYSESDPDTLIFGSTNKDLPNEDVAAVSTEPVKEIEDEFEPTSFDEGSGITQEVEVTSEKPTINDQFSEERPTLNEQFEAEPEKPASIADKHANHPIADIHKSINVNQRYMFLNDLFDGNVQEYEYALIEVDMSQSFDDSVEILVQNYSKKYDWDMNSEEVKELLKVIFKKFR